MRSHQKRIIREIYDACGGSDAHLSASFEKWQRDLALNRGELDRKKKVGQDQLTRAIGVSNEEINLSQYVYSVELYLLLRAYGIIESCVGRALLETDKIPPVLLSALTIHDYLAAFLTSNLAHEFEIEKLEISTLVMSNAGESITDSLQAEFMNLIPRETRHAIGSFFTPQWLARHVLRSVGFLWERPDSLKQSLCDPSCGSGVFLIAAAEEIRQAVLSGLVSEQEGLSLIRNNLFGIDIELVPCLLTIASLVLAGKNISTSTNPGIALIPITITQGDSLDSTVISKKMDLVVGNPPWVNWEYMPDQYKEKHINLWPELGIFDLGKNAFAFSKEDISALFVAHAVEFRLAENGKFGFVLPESLLKSSLNHRGFRRFTLGSRQDPYEITSAEDFVNVRPFEGVANRTVILFGNKSGTTTYPLPYIHWSKVNRSSQVICGSAEIDGIKTIGAAQLADANDLSSSWSTGSLESFTSHRALDGKNPYRARTGLFTGGANAVYHLRVTDSIHEELIAVTNVIERAKRIAPQVSAKLEQDYIYPFLRGRDVTQWSHKVELAVLLPHTEITKMMPVSPRELKTQTPRTFEYLTQFRSILDDRKGFSAWEGQYRDVGFYACQRVGDYTFSDWKVVWRYISPRFTTAVIGPVQMAGMAHKPVIVNEKLMLIACSSSEEAHYVGGVLASSLVVQHVHSRMVSTQISPSIISGISIPRFDNQNPNHRAISEISRLGHERVASGGDLTVLISELDCLVADLWNVSAQDAEFARSANPFSLSK